MRLRTLEIALERLEGIGAPLASLEQYCTTPALAARLLYHAWTRGDIEGKKVCDLGCGNGILACGAALLGASEVLGVEIDGAALEVARRNAEKLRLPIRFLCTSVASDEAFEGLEFDTVVMNPPFGAQARHADRPFIDRALRLAGVVYTVVNAGTLPFMQEYVKGRARVDEAVRGALAIPRTFHFHREERREIRVEVLRLVRTHGGGGPTSPPPRELPGRRGGSGSAPAPRPHPRGRHRGKRSSGPPPGSSS